jgi:hypothetical protein
LGLLAAEAAEKRGGAGKAAAATAIPQISLVHISTLFSA